MYYTIVSMLQTKEIGALLSSAKVVHSALAADRVVWMRAIECTVSSSKAAIKALHEQIELLHNEDKRFGHLKKAEGDPSSASASASASASTVATTRQLVEEWICQKKRLGATLAKTMQQCKAFITTGDPRFEAKPSPAKEESGGGLFSTLGGFFGMGGTKKPEAVKEEDPAVVLAELVISEKDSTPDTIYQALMNAAKKATRQKESFNEWVKALQMLFGTLFKVTLVFFSEAVDVERLKDFLTARLDKLKTENTAIKQANKELQGQLSEHESVACCPTV